MEDEDVGRTYLQYYIQNTAGLHTEGLLENISTTGPGRCAGFTDFTVTKGNRYGFNDMFFHSMEKLNLDASLRDRFQHTWDLLNTYKISDY